MVEKGLVARSFRYMATEYFLAEGALPERDFLTVHFFLHGHSLELGFKAFLSTNDRGIEELKLDFGHSLEKLLQECVTAGLAAFFTDIAGLQECVRMIDKDYARKQFEYSEKAMLILPELAAVRKLVGELLAATKTAERNWESDRTTNT